MTTHTRYAAIAIVSITALSASAAAQQDPAQGPASQTMTANRMTGTTTLVGCLYRESDIPGRNVAQRGGLLDDYILTDAAVATPAGAGGAVGTSGTVPPAGKLYEIERIDEARLAPLAGKRVEVTGQIDADPEHLRGAAPDMNDLPEFETTSIREVSGTCPATPKL